MGAVDVCVCPHCEEEIERSELLDSLAVRAIGPKGRIHLIICPHCNKPLGTVFTPLP